MNEEFMMTNRTIYIPDLLTTIDDLDECVNYGSITKYVFDLSHYK